MITRSATNRRRSIRPAHRAFDSNWAGFFGVGPDPRTRRLPMPGSSMIALTSTSSFMSRFDRPVVVGNSKNRVARGLRRSAETSTTRRPAWASATARFADVVLLPSRPSELVMMTTRT